MESCNHKGQKNQRLSGQKTLNFIALLPIRFYQYLISPLLGPKCRFEPSCSHYAIEAVESHGLLAGLWLACKRLGKCHPWHRGGYDPVPEAPKH